VDCNEKWPKMCLLCLRAYTIYAKNEEFSVDAGGMNDSAFFPIENAQIL
jgi:hypothetical protein